MATTTNFGWTTPDDTSLVKDGAAAIRTLGQSIDTSMMDLEGGTTGQVLSKASNADMDFTWVTTDDANAIQNSIVDAKGDLIAATAADTPARLAVGTNGQVLTADSTAATGIKWAAPAGGGKVLQMVSATYSTQTVIASTSFSDSGLTASITPTSATSKILVMVNQQAYITRNSDQQGAGIQLVRGATNIFTGDAEQFYVYVGTGSNAGQIGLQATLLYVDSPSSTSSLTYKTQWKAASTANSGQVTLQNASGVSSIILMEIGA
jgi:hypothetical protein